MNKTVLITGASSGIGLEFAKIFAEKGDNVILVARSEDKLIKIRKHLVEKYNNFQIPTYNCLGNHDTDNTSFEETLKLYKMENGYYKYHHVLPTKYFVTSMKDVHTWVVEMDKVDML